MITKTSVHALTAVAALAELDRGAYAGAGDVAERIGAPRNYLGKLMKTLADEGVLESQKGKGGGFRLARDAQRISLLDVMEPIERVSRWSGCFLGRRRCSDDAPCAVHYGWGKVRDAYLKFLKETTVADLVRQRTLTVSSASGFKSNTSTR
jgi:Rrf2 family transcriptional regulator, iron-sulfur cluster assembly transcription factor